MERKDKLMGKVAALCLSLLLVSCGAKKAIVTDADVVMPTTKKITGKAAIHQGELNDVTSQQNLLQKVLDNQVYAKNITGGMSFQLQAGDKNIEVSGTLRMRKDEVIRIQLNAPILGFEVGRLEFTPDYVLILDRIHKEYIKADYTQVDFLKNQGITFYSLQALFWNELTLPGVKEVTKADFKKFLIDLNAVGNDVPVSYQAGKMKYQWGVERVSGRINQADVTYKASGSTSQVSMKYEKFKNVGVKMFPAKQTLSFVTDATQQKREVTFTIDMNDVKTDSKWDAQTEVSSKYKKVSPESVLSKIMNM